MKCYKILSFDTNSVKNDKSSSHLRQHMSHLGDLKAHLSGPLDDQEFLPLKYMTAVYANIIVKSEA